MHFAELDPTSKATCLEKGKSKRCELSLPSNKVIIMEYLQLYTHMNWDFSVQIQHVKTGPKQCDYCTVHLPLTQDYGYLELPESQKISASTGSRGHGVILCPLRFPAEQCKVWDGSLMLVLLPSPHQCRWTEGCMQPCADSSQVSTAQPVFSAYTRCFPTSTWLQVPPQTPIVLPCSQLQLSSLPPLPAKS